MNIGVAMSLLFKVIRLGIEEFASAVEKCEWGSGTITEIHWHHTYRPNHEAFWDRGGAKLVREIYDFHVSVRGWRHTGQHLTIDPEGYVWLGRPWILKPASATGFNGRDNGPHAFMFEMIGDFRRGRDALTGAQLDAALLVTAIIQRRFGLGPEKLRLHKEMQPTECPGEIEKSAIVAAVRHMHLVLADNKIEPEETYAPMRVASRSVV